ncbi:MAG TPA: flagellar basal body-associated FliL family protein [Edaphobacter sp.]|nr:flagellar basal body-associated FliL family protein [Edaphobacter sp.]
MTTASPSIAEPVNAISPAPAGSKRPIGSMLIAMALGAIIASACFSGALYFLVRSGRLSMKSAAKRPAAAAKVETHLITLDPLLANLAGDGGSYLRLSLALQVADLSRAKGTEQKGGNAEEDTASLRDAALTVLGEQTAQGLLASGGREQLKLALKKAFEARDAGLQVKEIYFTDFLVQR